MNFSLEYFNAQWSISVVPDKALGLHYTALHFGGSARGPGTSLAKGNKSQGKTQRRLCSGHYKLDELVNWKVTTDYVGSYTELYRRK